MQIVFVIIANRAIFGQLKYLINFFSIGLCPDCSDKLNYHSKKREIKRLKKNTKHNKHNGNPRSISPSVQSTSSRINDEGESSAGTIPSDNAMQTAGSDAAQQQLEQIFWAKTTNEEEKTREEEFDEFLADLLL